jgi:hypothetical protein
LQGCRLLLERGFYRDGGINFSPSYHHSETCITGMVLALTAYFRLEDERVHSLAVHLLQQQLPDGGWNCQSYRGDTHSSFHTTISALEGLEEYRKWPAPGVRRQGAGGEGIGEREAGAEIEAAQARGGDFLLRHRLFRSHRTGEVFDARMLRFAFPPRWRYDVLRGLEYFSRAGAVNEGDQGEGERGKGKRGKRDERFEDAIELVKKKRRKDGRWALARGMTGRVFFELEAAGEPSRWNTLRALRVLKWWEARP